MSSREDVEPVECLKGKAGDGKRGFVLQSAMGLTNDHDLFQAIVMHVRESLCKKSS
jgi:hypothetical protein